MSGPVTVSEWRKVRTFIDDRMEDARRKLEADRDDIDTAVLRGRIRELRALLEWGEPSETPGLIVTPDYTTGY